MRITLLTPELLTLVQCGPKGDFGFAELPALPVVADQEILFDAVAAALPTAVVDLSGFPLRAFRQFHPEKLFATHFDRSGTDPSLEHLIADLRLVRFVTPSPGPGTALEDAVFDEGAKARLITFTPVTAKADHSRDGLHQDVVSHFARVVACRQLAVDIVPAPAVLGLQPLADACREVIVFVIPPAGFFQQGSCLLVPQIRVLCHFVTEPTRPLPLLSPQKGDGVFVPVGVTTLHDGPCQVPVGHVGLPVDLTNQHDLPPLNIPSAQSTACMPCVKVPSRDFSGWLVLLFSGVRMSAGGGAPSPWRNCIVTQDSVLINYVIGSAFDAF